MVSLRLRLHHLQYVAVGRSADPGTHRRDRDAKTASYQTFPVPELVRATNRDIDIGSFTLGSHFLSGITAIYCDIFGIIV